MYHDILVHIDAGRRTNVRLNLAIGLAKRFGARLFGAFAQLDHEAPAIVAGRIGERLAAAAQEAEAAFAATTEAAGIKAEWLQMPHGEANLLIRDLVIASRYADLVVLGQYHPEHDGRLVPSEMNEQLVMQSGAPVLFVPHSGHFDTLGERVLVAWNGSRECARAVRDAMPLIREAGELRILGLHAQRESERPMPRTNIVTRLTGGRAEPHYDVMPPPKDIGVMDVILSRAADLGSDLLVMGGQGHYGLPFLSRGAGTQFMLRHMTVPVLMAH